MHRYLTKNCLEVNAALSVLLDARDHLEAYGSRAADDGTPERDARFMMQRVLNRLDTELALSEAASMLLNHDHDGSSEQCIYVDLWDAVRVAREIFLLAGDNGAARPVNTDADAASAAAAGTATSGEGEGESFGPASELLSLGREQEIDVAAIDVAGSADIYQLNGEPLPVSWMEHYQHRGDGLRRLSPVIYRCTIQIVPAPAGVDASAEEEQAAKQDRRGRPTNVVWQFAGQHPLYGAYVQQQRSRFVCPIVGNVPHPPQPPLAGELPNNAWYERLKRVVEFYVAGFVPWDGATPRPLTYATLKSYIDKERTGARLEERLPDDMKFDSDPKVMLAQLREELTPARIVAAGRLRLLENFMHGLQVQRETLRASKQMRMRNRHEWTDAERNEYAESLHAAGRASEAEREIAKLKSRQEARAVSQDRERHTAQAEAWRCELEAELHDAFAPSGGAPLQRDTPDPRESRRPMPNHSRPDMDIKRIADKYGELLDDEPGQEAAAPAAEPAVAAAPPANLDTERPIPAIFATVSEQAYRQASRRWRDEFGERFKRGEDVPLPPLNQRQRAAGRRLLPVLRRMGAAQRDGDASRTRKEYSEAVALVHRMHYLLVGAPGTGKSLLLRALLQLMDEEDLGCAIFSAYTGVAVTALPLPAATYCKLTGIPGDAGSTLEDLPAASDRAQRTFNAIVGDAHRLIMIVLDEASFLGTPHLHHLDQRLQQLLGCKLPFGGLVVVLAGGACLPLRALPLAHSPSLPCLLTFTGVYAQTSTSCSR